ncbi:MAG: CapA family protein [Treponema sp.]|nr:CapA family protein [Treponema sp.]
MQVKEKTDTLSLIFGGDIMAHKPNFNMKNYPAIWEDIKPLVSSYDLAFANIEAPVSENLPYSSFPNFNMHGEYPEEAVKAGFNVFSLVNNHTNDQALEGMTDTLRWAENIERQTAGSGRPVYFSGLKKNKGTELDFRIIEKNGWKIIFCAVTEILNRPTFKDSMNFISPSKKGQEQFIAQIKKLREENPAHLFVLSIHSYEPEYVSPVEKSRRDYYLKLLESGADVLWTNHPHIPREKEFIGNRATGKLEKVIIYGNGNLISGQRWEPDFKNPSNPRDDTGDGYLLEVQFAKSESMAPYIESQQTFFITTYINSRWEFVIRQLNDDFIKKLNDTGNTTWSKYMEHRKKITEMTKETITWQ